MKVSCPVLKMISDKVSVLIMTLDFVGFLSSVSYFCAVTEIRQLVANSAQNSQPQETFIFTFTLKITNISMALCLR